MTLLQQLLGYRKQKGIPEGKVDFIMGKSDIVPLAQLETDMILRIYGPIRELGYDVLLQMWHDGWQVHLYKAETGTYLTSLLAVDLEAVVQKVSEYAKEKRTQK